MSKSHRRSSGSYGNSVPRPTLVLSDSHQKIQALLQPKQSITPNTQNSSKLKDAEVETQEQKIEVLYDPSFPDFSKLSLEKARKSEYNVSTGKWKMTDILFRMAADPFARGSMRYAFHIQICDENANPVDGKFVAKMSIKYHEKISAGRGCLGWLATDPESIDRLDDREDCFQDVRLQMYAKQWAKQFNSFDPPKKVDFLPAYCLDLMERPGCPTCCVEPYIEGTYKKHNNNYGYVSEDYRNTPQAFSHFTYHYSSHSILICDIQGVGDVYTDPLMHSTLNEEFGRGNLGSEGMEKFLSTHHCNPICDFLRLPSVNAVCAGDVGTLPGLRSAPFPRRPSPYPSSPSSPSHAVDLSATANATTLIFKSMAPPAPSPLSSGNPTNKNAPPGMDQVKTPPLYACGCSVM